MRKFLTSVFLMALCMSLRIAFAETTKPSGGKMEQLVMRMLPQEKFNRALGFFGPVTKKYMPVFLRFNETYLSSTNKMAVVRQYLPQARSALNEAKAMKIPAKYEKEKADYIQMGEAFLAVLKLTARFG